MNFLDYWFKMKVTTVIVEVLAVAIMLAFGGWLYGVDPTNKVGILLAKGAILTTLGYTGLVIWYLTLTLSSIEIDSKPVDRRTDGDKQLQFFVSKIATVKLLVALVALLFLTLAASGIL